MRPLAKRVLETPPSATVLIADMAAKMRREGIDFWIIINRENNADPVYMSMVPEPVMYTRRTSILMFYDRGEDDGVERLSGS